MPSTTSVGLLFAKTSRLFIGVIQYRVVYLATQFAPRCEPLPSRAIYRP